MESKLIDYKDLSIYRSELMGWSILWVMMLHFTFNQIKPLGFIAQYGFAGVDIFIFVSGFGLFYSLDKNDNLVSFYRKRLLRIFPTYYIIGLITNLLITHDDILSFLFRYSTLGFWIGNKYAEWFIPSIILLYLIAPFIKKAIERKWLISICTFIVCLYLTSYFLADKEDILDRSHYFFLYRIPAFIFGMTCAYWLKNNMSTIYFLYVMILGIPFFTYLYPFHHQVYNFKYYSLAFLLPLFVTIFLTLSKCTKCLSPFLTKIGRASLEIYLIQGTFFTLVLNGVISTRPESHDIFSIFMIVASIVLGIITHWLIDKSGLLKLL